MYLNEKKLKMTILVSRIQMVIGMIFSVFFGIGVVGGIFNYGEMRESLFIYVILILPFIWLVYLSRQNKKRVERTRRLNQMFCSDEDGDIRTSQLIQILDAKNEYQAAEMVGKLIGNGFLTNCTVEHQPHDRVVLYRNASDCTSGVVSVECPGCAASVEKRSGFITSCPYCGTKIS